LKGNTAERKLRTSRQAALHGCLPADPLHAIRERHNITGDKPVAVRVPFARARTGLSPKQRRRKPNASRKTRHQAPRAA
jgi:hypothetical protein